MKKFIYLIFFTILLIVFIYCYYRLIFTDFNFRDSLLFRILIYSFISIIIFLFIPVFVVFFSLSLIFGGETMNIDKNIIDNINKHGIKNLYDLLIKYNYPCFIK